MQDEREARTQFGEDLLVAYWISEFSGGDGAGVAIATTTNTIGRKKPK